MLPLEDPRWDSLQHAYGAATDIPDLLRALERASGPTSDYRDEPWFSLWSSLCHQGDIYSASYAAVPHIVRIASAAAGPIAFGFFLLPASIEVARHQGRGPPLLPDLETAYRQAIDELVGCIHQHWRDEWNRDMLLSALGALAVAKGDHEVAEAILNLDNDLVARINAGEWT